MVENDSFPKEIGIAIAWPLFVASLVILVMGLLKSTTLADFLAKVGVGSTLALISGGYIYILWKNKKGPSLQEWQRRRR